MPFDKDKWLWVDGGDYLGKGDKETLAKCERHATLENGPTSTEIWMFDSPSLRLMCLVRYTLGEFVRIDWYAPKEIEA